jgi:YD repeat-containing protein
VVEKTDGDDVTSYSYDALGALRSVTLPDARVIEYVVDASGRRIGKKIDGEVVQELLYRTDLAPIGERDENGDVARFVYASHVTCPTTWRRAARCTASSPISWAACAWWSTPQPARSRSASTTMNLGVC